MAVDSSDQKKSSNEFELEVLDARLADENTSEVDRKAFQTERDYYKFLVDSEKDNKDEDSEEDKS